MHSHTSISTAGEVIANCRWVALSSEGGEEMRSDTDGRDDPLLERSTQARNESGRKTWLLTVTVFCMRVS
jgi:hypothetical protein